MSDILPLEQSAVPLRPAIYARYGSIWNYWLMIDKRINGRRFTVEQYGKARSWAAPIIHGTDYIIDGVYVASTEFDRIMRLEGVP